MKRVFLIVSILALGIVPLWGCGGAGPGAPGSIGCEDFGLICEVTITPTYLGNNTTNVDAFQDQCTAGPPPTFEHFTDHGANVAVSLRLVNPTTTVTPPSLFVESYTIEYRRSNDSIGSPPIELYTGFSSFSVIPPTGTDTSTVTEGLIFVDLTRKLKYGSDMLSGIFDSTTGSPSFINNYTAIYTIQGQIKGNRVTITGTQSFSIGDYNNC
jgi:hypothetical protein